MEIPDEIVKMEMEKWNNAGHVRAAPEGPFGGVRGFGRDVPAHVGNDPRPIPRRVWDRKKAGDERDRTRDALSGAEEGAPRK